MRNKTIQFSLLMLLLLVLPFLLIPTNAVITNIWGASIGDVKTYTYKTTYSGSITGFSDNGDYTFTIINIWDNDANNYTELLYSRARTFLGSPAMDLIILQDGAVNWNNVDLRQPVGADIFPLVPIIYSSSPWMGMNWTAEIDIINVLTNWTATINGTMLVIHHWTTGTDGGTGAFYTQDEWIRWNITTGWLDSYENSLDYGSPADYIATTSVAGLTIDVPTTSADITLIIGIVAVCIGGAAIAITFLIWRKSKR